MMEQLSLILMIIGIILMFIQFFPVHKKATIKSRQKNPNISIIIPARDESQVIESLLKSIKKQTTNIPMQNVYIIVENKKDETVEIAKKYKVNILYRKNLNLKRKGYALQEALDQINKKFDLFFIFDADNILDEKYIEKMILLYKKGYDIGVGYRNTKNGNQNMITSSSSTMFAILNFLNTKTDNIVISGTGFFITGKLIDKWHGYPFHSLTEDYELKIYSLAQNINCGFSKEAIFYDEQPTTMKTSIMQRTRWVKGFFQARKKWLMDIIKSLKKKENRFLKIKEIFVITPYLFLITSIIINMIYHIIQFIQTKQIYDLFLILITLIIIYIVLAIFTFIILLNDNNLNLSKSMKIKTIFFQPLFLVTFIHCAILAIVNREIKWQKIEHHYNEII